MASCAVCKTTVLFGGVTQSGARYCSAKCAGKGALAGAISTIPRSDIEARAQEIRSGQCPKCGSMGSSVDVQLAYRALSLVFVTRWSTHQLVACRGCGNKLRAREMAVSLLVGWWGFPWGLLATPIQVGRNVVGMFNDPASTGPTPQLLAIAGATLARERGLVAPAPVKS
jgi:hypothetical protein